MRILAAALALLLASPAAAQPARYEIDPAHAVVAFLVHHIGYAKVLGQFLKVEGSFTYDAAGQRLEDLVVTLRADSVFSNDAARDEHLKGPDFLDTARHPSIVFRGTAAEPTGPDTGRITGDLTILGVTRPATVTVRKNKEGPYPFGDSYAIGISARATVKRSDFGMVYAVENGWVGDEVEVLIELEAIRR